MSISSQLSERYGAGYAAGCGHQKCPKCGRETLSITRDDNFAKCFHQPESECGFRDCLRDELSDHPINDVLQRVFQDFHGLYLSRGEHTSGSVMSYVVTTRLIHPSVAVAADIGEVPGSYKTKLSGYFSEALVSIKNRIASFKENSKVPKDLQKLVDRLEKHQLDLSLWKDKLIDLIDKIPGWMAFFYTDAKRKFCGIRFREVGKKAFCSFKPMHQGVFGYTLFNEDSFGIYDDQPGRMKNNHVYVHEGEFNCLAHQSMEYRLHSTYCNAVSVGSASSVDVDTLKALRQPLWVVQDADEAGENMLKTIQEKTSFLAKTLKENDTVSFKDFWDMFHAYKSEYLKTIDLAEDMGKIPALDKEAMGKLEKAFNKIGYRKHWRLTASVKAELDEILFHEGKRQAETFSLASTMLLPEIVDLATAADAKTRLYYDENYCYIMDCQTQKLFTMEPDDPSFADYIHCFINPKDRFFPYFVADLHRTVRTQGKLVTVRNYSYFDYQNRKLYFYDNDKTVYVITPSGIERKQNGVDGILFLYNRDVEPWEYIKPAARKNKFTMGNLLDSITISGENVLSAEEARRLLKCHVEFILLHNESFVRHILLLYGEAGSGKTTLAEFIGRLLFGRMFTARQITNEDDFSITVSRNRFTVYDNVDSYAPWLCDRLAVAATGGGIEKRRLYTNGQTVRLVYQSSLILTSRTPAIRRDDIAERTIIIKLDKRDTKANPLQLFGLIQESRNEIISALIDEIILKFGHYKDIVSKHRLVQFFSFCCSDKTISQNAWDDIFRKVTVSQNSFTVEETDFFNLLPDVLTATRRIKDGSDLQGFYGFTMRELCESFSTLAENKGIKFHHAGKIQSLQRHYRQIKAGLLLHYDIQETEDKHTKVVHYYFKPLNQISARIYDEEPVTVGTVNENPIFMIGCNLNLDKTEC
jgi:hypothetical protein